MQGRMTYRQLAYEIALDSHGYITTRAARDHGIPPIELAKLASRGALENITYGVYRVVNWPPDPLDQPAEALARAGDGSYLHGESVLAIHNLADAHPKQIHVALPRRTRARFPAFMSVTKAAPPPRMDYVAGLACQPVPQAILECRGRIDRTRLQEAADEALLQGLITPSENRQLSQELAA